MKLYSRLSLITSLTLVTGYAFVYAYTNLTLSDADSGKPLTSTLMQTIMGNVNELNTRVNSLASGWGNLWNTGALNSINYTAGNVGIGNASPNATLDIKRTTSDSNFATYIDGTDVANYGLWVNIANITSSKAIADFKSGNVSRLFVRADGNVGVGTTSPTDTANFWRALDIQSNGGAATYYRASGTNPSSQYFAIGYSPTAAYLLQANNAPIVFYTNNTEKMRLDATGNVGIGTPSPSSTTGYSGPLLHLSGEQPAVILQNTSTSAAKWEIGTNWFGGANTPTLTMGVDGVYSMALQKGGNVGIGTTSPGVKFHVLWNNEIARFETTSDGANQYAQIAILAPGGANYIWSNNNNSPWYYGGNGALNIYTGQASPIAFFTNGNNQRMTIAGNGNVMIGTTTDAGYKLDVNGSIRWTTVTPSDKNLKKNIQTLSGALDKIEELRGVTYEWKDSSKGSGSQVGVIAQEVEQIFPELVNTDKQGMKAVNYAALVAPLIEAVKEQQKQISALQAKVQALENGR